VSEPPRLRVIRLDTMVVNEDHTVTGTFRADDNEILKARFTIDEKGFGHVRPEDFFTGWNGSAESVRSVIHAAAAILRAHELSPLHDSN
jgi:hypothetical protein